MSVLFLDIDGVLNTNADWVEYNVFGHPHNKLKTGMVINRTKLALLDHLITETGAQLVLSSTWRHHFSFEQLNDFFKLHGWTHPVDVWVGATDNHLHGLSDDPVYRRGSEIRGWLDDHPDEINFAILDDNVQSFADSGFEELERVGDWPDDKWTGDFINVNEDQGFTYLQCALLKQVLA